MHVKTFYQPAVGKAIMHECEDTVDGGGIEIDRACGSCIYLLAGGSLLHSILIDYSSINSSDSLTVVPVGYKIFFYISVDV